MDTSRKNTNNPYSLVMGNIIKTDGEENGENPLVIQDDDSEFVKRLGVIG